MSCCSASRRPAAWPRATPSTRSRALVERFHGAEAAAAATAHFERVFVSREAPEDIEEHTVSAPNGSVHLPELITEAFGGSRSEARRLVLGGAVKLDGEPVGELDVPAGRLDGAVLQVGRRRFRRLRLG